MSSLAPTTQSVNSGDERQSWESLYAKSMDVFAYSIKAWYTQKRAKPSHGDPLEPREPGYYGPEVRLTARMCDLAAHPRFEHLDLGDLAAAALGLGVQETETEKAARKGILVDQWNELTSAVGVFSVESMFDRAILTGAERDVMRLVLAGRDQSQLTVATGKALGTVKVLRKRAVDKLRGLRAQAVA